MAWEVSRQQETPGLGPGEAVILKRKNGGEGNWQYV